MILRSTRIQRLSTLTKMARAPFLPAMSVMVTDFDDTITEKDTIALVAEAAYDCHPEFPKPWSYFGEIYSEHYTAWSKKWAEEHGKDEPTTIPEEREFQSGLSAVELSGVIRAEDLGLFGNIPQEVLRSKAEKVQIRKGYPEFLARLKTNPHTSDSKLSIPLIIISVNWTSLIIKEFHRRLGVHTVYEPDVTLSDHDEKLGSAQEVLIFCNELEFDSNGVSTGKVGKRDVSRGLRTGKDKEELMKRIGQKLPSETQGGVYYFGDSRTDVLAMLEADVGVIVGPGAAVEACDRLGITVIDLDEAAGQKDFNPANVPKPFVYKLRDWDSASRLIL